MKAMQEIEMLAIEIADADITSFQTLFENGVRYYNPTLYTTGEGHAPIISVWSWEAPETESSRQGDEVAHRDRRLRNSSNGPMPFISID
ncbi:DUF4303 domain-containing protein [Paenibacillus sp. FSL H8-0537]|uniref:DUF4303 domain-containing protein n=1 Tax=Paenibacillus sp. FSL H8-0537 TaxID=2921399 RepID=UPI0031016879